MGNESSNTRQQAYPAAPIIKPILKKPNVYPAKYMTEPFYYIYPVYSAEHDQFQRMIPEKPVERSKVHHNHHHHHHHHHHRHRPRHRMDRACQTTPTLLLGADDIVDKPRYTPTFLRDRSTSSEASIEEYSSTSATVVRSAQTPHSAIKVDQSTSAAPIKKPLTPKNTDNQYPPPMVIRSTVLSPTVTPPKTS